MKSIISDSFYLSACGKCDQDKMNCMYGCEKLVRDFRDKVDMLPEDFSNLLFRADTMKRNPKAC